MDKKKKQKNKKTQNKKLNVWIRINKIDINKDILIKNIIKLFFCELKKDILFS